jgi:hypothetical protein
MITYVGYVLVSREALRPTMPENRYGEIYLKMSMWRFEMN